MKKMKNWMKAALMLVVFGAAGTTQAQAQITAGCEQKWGPDSVKTIQNISVYREFFKQKNYASAYSYEKQKPQPDLQTHPGHRL